MTQGPSQQPLFQKVPVMRSFLLSAVAVAILSTFARSDEPLKSMPSFPISINAKQVREFPKLAIDFANVKLRGEAITVVPISIEPGVTGAVLIGNGTYSYSPKPGKQFEGHFRSVMLRFNPADADSIIKLSAGKSIYDRGAAEMARHLLASTFRHCYHRGQDALIPPKDAIAVDLYSQEHGNLLISADKKVAMIYNFTERAEVYAKK
jgi:hypothetical protein